MEYRPFNNVGALIIKVSHRCNLDCKYCYESTGPGSDMEIETFRNVISNIFRESLQKKICITFHGGEPTLLDNSWYVMAVSHARKTAKVYNKCVFFGIQTNLIRITESQAKLYHDLGISVGASLDGPFSSNDPLRNRFKLAYKNYNRLRAQGLNIGILMTINHSNWNHFKKIMRWVESDLDVKKIKVNPIYSVGTGIELPDLPGEFTFFAQKDILEFMISTNAEGLTEDNMSTELERFFYKDKSSESNKDSLCRSLKCGAGTKVLGISPNGNIFPCGRFEWHDIKNSLGKFHELPIAEAFENKVSEFHGIENNNWNKCETCEAKSICSYGCQAFIIRSRSKKNIECLPTRLRYNYIKDNADRLEPIAENIHKHTCIKDRI
ncbi:MAG: radical SAM protein [Candidatus Thiodiazotropha sp.]